MLKVMLVDDEPFILRGLSLLIDWREQGFEIVKTASNGQEALEYLRREPVHLVLADIRMPVMTGLELVEALRGEYGEGDRPYFAIMSGYNDFEYARKAICNACLDYILKPVSRKELLSLLERVRNLYREAEVKRAEEDRREKAFFARRLLSFIFGKQTAQNRQYLSERLRLSEGIRYLMLEIDSRDEAVHSMSEEEKCRCMEKLYDACLAFLGENRYHCIFEVSRQKNNYDVGVIYCDRLARERGCGEQEYLDQLREWVTERTGVHVLMFIGDRVNSLEELGDSVRTVAAARSFENFRLEGSAAELRDEMARDSGLLWKETLDALVLAVERRDEAGIQAGADALFQMLQRDGTDTRLIEVNINYLLFQLVYLAVREDEQVNQEEILHFISANVFSGSALQGGKAHLVEFANEYASYLAQLRDRSARGVLASIEREVRENYAQNLTLKELSRKYYINGAYLGQLFRKQYGVSFKDYLNEYRMEQAAELLLHTDKKVVEIAEQVGYRDADYFINRFIAARGCTPSRFRRQNREPKP